MALTPFIKLKDLDFNDLIELPTERDGTLLLSTVKGQFNNAVGIRFKTESGSWRGLRTEGNIIQKPVEGWGQDEYHVVRKKILKREASDSTAGPLAKLSKMTNDEILSEMIVSGLPEGTKEEDMEGHFKQFGELDLCNMKYNKEGGCKGFGFIRFKTVEAVEKALLATHVFGDRKVSLNFSRSAMAEQCKKDEVPTKLFVGRLPHGTTVEDVKNHFCKFGVLKDVFLPSRPFKGYGFVTFASQLIANKVISETHVLNGTYLNVTNPPHKPEGAYRNRRRGPRGPRENNDMTNDGDKESTGDKGDKNDLPSNSVPQEDNNKDNGNVQSSAQTNVADRMGALATMITKIQSQGSGPSDAPK